MAEKPRAEKFLGPAEVRVRTVHTGRTGHLRVELLTDPWSVWCWGFEPVRRALELRYPTIEFRFLVGGMFPTMPDPDELGFDVDRFFAIVQRTTGMPIHRDAAQRDRPKSTYPACRFVHAVRIVAPDKERAYLRGLREAAYLDGENISRRTVGRTVAQRVGVDVARFDEALESGQADHAFKQQIERLTEQALLSYPTLLLTAGLRTTRIEGFQGLPAVLGIAQGLTGRVHPARPDPPLEEIVPVGERVATREVAEVLGVSIERAAETLWRARGRLGIRRERHPTGDVWSRS